MKRFCIFLSFVKVTKFYSTLNTFQGIYLCKFVQDGPTGSEVKETADLDSLYWMVTLKISSRSPNSNHLTFLLCHIDTKYKFGQNPPLNSRDNVCKPYSGPNLTFQSASVTLKIRSRSPTIATI